MMTAREELVEAPNVHSLLLGALIQRLPSDIRVGVSGGRNGDFQGFLLDGRDGRSGSRSRRVVAIICA